MIPQQVIWRTFSASARRTSPERLGNSRRRPRGRRSSRALVCCEPAAALRRLVRLGLGNAACSTEVSRKHVTAITAETRASPLLRLGSDEASGTIRAVVVRQFRKSVLFSS